MGIRDRVFNWLRAFLGIDHLTAEVRLNEQAHTREIAHVRAEVTAALQELDTFKAALKKAADRAPQRQASPTDFESAQIIALENFKENA